MTAKTGWLDVMSELQAIEARHGSVLKAPKSEVDYLHKMQGIKDLDIKYVEMTRHEYNVLKKALEHRITVRFAQIQLGYSSSWVRYRLGAIRNGQYLITDLDEKEE